MLLKDKLKPYRLLLASQSPRRRELMTGCGLPYELAPKYECEEVYPAGMPGEEVPLYLSRLKSEAYPAALAPGRTHTFAAKSSVWFRPLADEEIAYYLDACRPYDKAGSYGIQEWIGYAAIEKINGSFYNVMGLPIQKVYTELDKFLK